MGYQLFPSWELKWVLNKTPQTSINFSYQAVKKYWVADLLSANSDHLPNSEEHERARPQFTAIGMLWESVSLAYGFSPHLVPSRDLHSNFGLPLRHAEKINCSKSFNLTYVWKALFLVISSNYCVSMVNNCGSGRVQTYTLFEERCPICQAGGYCGEGIQDHSITLFTMVGIWCWSGREQKTRGVLILSVCVYSGRRHEGRSRWWFLLWGLFFIYKQMTSSSLR